MASHYFKDKVQTLTQLVRSTISQRLYEHSFICLGSNWFIFILRSNHTYLLSGLRMYLLIECSSPHPLLVANSPSFYLLSLDSTSL